MNTNKAIVIGRIGSVPELKKEGHKLSTTFTVGNTTFYNGVEEVVWYNMTAIGKEAKIICEYLTKGDLCCVEGKYTTDAHSIKVSKVTFLASRKREISSDTVKD